MLISAQVNKTVNRSLAAFTLNNDGTKKANWKIDIEDIIIASHERMEAPERWCMWRVLSNVFDPVKLTCKIDMQYIADCTAEQLAELDSIGYRSI